MTRYLLPLLFLAGCSPASEDPDMGHVDASASDLGHGSAADAADVASAVDASADLRSGCDDVCQTLDVTATVGANMGGFDRAFYGLTAPELADSHAWELHVEVYAGGDDACPEASSPTPDRTLIVTSLPFPEFPGEVSDADGLVVSLLDFQGTLTMEPALAATGESLTFTNWSLCVDCVAGDPNGFLAFDLHAPLTDGLVEGHVYATHCASLDSRP